MTISGRESIGTWLLFVLMVVAPIRFARRRCRSGMCLAFFNNGNFCLSAHRLLDQAGDGLCIGGCLLFAIVPKGGRGAIPSKAAKQFLRWADLE